MKPNDFNPEKIIEQGRKLRNEQIVDVDEESIQFVLMVIGDYIFGADATQIKEIVPPAKITFVPGLPDYFLGLIHLRGDLEAVVDLGKILGLSSKPDSELSRILMLRKDDLSVGVCVDYVSDIADIPVSKISKESEFGHASARPHLQGQFEFKSSVVSIVDLMSILRFIQPKTTGSSDASS
ncbi:MAG: chemotaxis protein CheW [Bacteroidetes bacterium]|nr:chemotaxis protein CheW [Bacteroidota bacterium]